MSRSLEGLGPSGERAAERVRAIRRQQGLTLADVAARLESIGRPIQLTALSKIEKGQRRLDVDDLIALALALEVSPNWILLPAEVHDNIELLPGQVWQAANAWRWAARTMPAGINVQASIHICYGFRDLKWAEWMASRLRSIGYHVTMDEFASMVLDDEFGQFSAAARSIGLNDAKVVIAVLSPHFKEGAWQEEHLIAATAGTDRVLLPVMVEKYEPTRTMRAMGCLELFDFDEGTAAFLLTNQIDDAIWHNVTPVAAAPFPGPTPNKPDEFE